jgi:hypothetical protein
MRRTEMRRFTRIVLVVVLIGLPSVARASGGDGNWVVLGLTLLGVAAGPPEDPAACAMAQQLCKDYAFTPAQVEQLKRIFLKTGRGTRCLAVCRPGGPQDRAD